MRRWKILVVALTSALASAPVTVVGFWLWFERVCTDETTLVQPSIFRVSVPNRPDASARLYSLSYADQYLLVLSAKSSKHPEGYYLRLGTKEIGLPRFSTGYVPFFGRAFVDREVYAGYDVDATLAADWNMSYDHGCMELRIRITGFKGEQPDSVADKAMRVNMPIGYQNEIILTAKIDSGRT